MVVAIVLASPLTNLSTFLPQQLFSDIANAIKPTAASRPLDGGASWGLAKRLVTTQLLRKSNRASFV